MHAYLSAGDCTVKLLHIDLEGGGGYGGCNPPFKFQK